MTLKLLALIVSLIGPFSSSSSPSEAYQVGHAKERFNFIQSVMPPFVEIQ